MTRQGQRLLPVLWAVVLALFIVALAAHWWCTESYPPPAAVSLAARAPAGPPPALPPALPPAPRSDEEMAAALFHYLENPPLCCRKLTQFGGFVTKWGAVDGDMFVCLDEGRAPPPRHCLVYSVGVSDEWSFGRAAVRYGCQVYAFDPSMRKQNEADFGARFYRIGLGGRTETTRDGWDVMTLTDLRAKLGHSTRIIDYLKIDIEGGEWDWLESDVAGLEGVSQLGMEVHMQLDMQALRRYYDAFWRIQEAGFKMIHSNPYRAYGRNNRVKGVDGMVGTVYRLVWMRDA